MRRRVHFFILGAVVIAAWSASDALAEQSPESSNATTAPATTVPRPTTNAAVTTVPRPTTTAAATSVPTDGTAAPAGPTTPNAPAGTTTPVASTAPWIPVTANLVGLPSECGNLSSVVARPDRDMVIAGIAVQGVYAQVDSAATWTELGVAEGSATITNRMTSIQFDPEHPDTFWESGMYNGGGVYRTDDNGVTFRQLGDVVHSDLVSVDWADPERLTLLSATHEQPTVFRSADGGSTWQDVSGSLPEGIGYASSPLVLDAQTHLLGTNNGPASAVFRTTDGGATWTQVRAGGVLGAPLVVDGTIMWLMAGGGGLITSTDGGLTWTETPANGAIYTYAAHLIGLPDGRLATIGQGNVIVSADGGLTWSPIGSPLPYTPNGLAYSPAQSAFYAWRFDCDFTTDNAIPADAIVRLDVDVTG